MKVLSIDGGGIKGVIPAVVLSELEKRTGKRCSDMFDLIVGTSTGGILALGLSLGWPAKDLLKIYTDRGKDIFKNHSFRIIRSLGYILEAKYDEDDIENVLEDYFLHYNFGDCKTKTMITAYDPVYSETIFFKSWKDSFKYLKAKDVARCTSSAPTYFKPKKINILGKETCLIDGGVFINNPALSAYTTTIKYNPCEEIEVLSLGCGNVTNKLTTKKVVNFSSIDWLKRMIGVMMDGQSKSVDYQLENLMPTKNYNRIQVKLKPSESDMDNASSENIEMLINKSEKWLVENNDKFKNIIECL